MRITILDCEGGTGHKAVAAGIVSAIQKEYPDTKIEQKDMGSALAPDPIKSMSFGRYTMIDLHNTLAKKGWTWAIKILVRIGKIVSQIECLSAHSNIKSWLETYDEKPDLIISTIPMLNGALIEEASLQNIPVLVVSSDNDNSLTTHAWSNFKTPYHHVISYSCYEVAKTVNHLVEQKKIFAAGYPVREEFLKKYNCQETQSFRMELNIPEKNQVIGVMMGGLGGEATLKYAKKIIKAAQDKKIDSLHFSFFCGRNTKMKSELQRLIEKTGFKKSGNHYFHTASNVSIEMIGYSEEVYKYMSIASLWITKPGSSTWNEAIRIGVPMLLDRTSEPLPWEELNIEISETYGFGKALSSFDDLIDQIGDMISPKINGEYRKHLETFKEMHISQMDFQANVIYIIKNLLKEATQFSHIPIEEIQKKEVETVQKIDTFVKKNSLRFTFFTRILQNAFFSGFNLSDQKQKERRRALIHKFDAKPIEDELKPLISRESGSPIDSLYIPSKSKARTGNAIIYVLGKHYQGFNPNNYQHLLDKGADVVLFNPTEKYLSTMANDLSQVIERLKQKNPNQRLLLHGYSIGAHVAVAVASDYAKNKENQDFEDSISVIADRGFGNAQQLAEKITSIAKRSVAKRMIEEKFSLHADEKIKDHNGNILFITPTQGQDPFMHSKEDSTNFTKELYEAHKGKKSLYEMEGENDHWTPWDYRVHQRVNEFLKENKMIASDAGIEMLEAEFPAKPSSWFHRKIIPKIL